MAAPDPAMAAALAQHERIRRSTDLPLFYGRPDKDTIPARLLIDRIEKAAVIGQWDEPRRCAEFYMVLRDRALMWYDSLEHKDVDLAVFQQLKTAFLQTYESRTTAKTTCANFNELQQRTGETVNDFYNRVHAVVKKLGDMRPAALAAARLAHVGVADDLANNLKNEGSMDERKYWQQMLFTAGLRDDIRMKVMDENKDTLSDCFKAAAEHETLLNEKRRMQVNAVDFDALDDVPQTQVDAWDEVTLLNVNNIRVQYGRQPFRRSVAPAQQQYRRPPGPQRPPAGPPGQQQQQQPQQQQQNPARGVVCHYCHKLNHFQRDCRTRLAKGAPMVRNPNNKVNAVNEAPPAEQASTVSTIEALNWFAI
jgi:hypothetical protein